MFECVCICKRRFEIVCSRERAFERVRVFELLRESESDGVCVRESERVCERERWKVFENVSESA